MHIVILENGLKIGDVVHSEVELKEPTAGDIFAAQDAAERLVFAPSPDGKSLEPTLVVSSAKMGREILRRQIVRIGEVKSKDIDDELFGRLSAVDLGLIEHAASELDAASVSAMRRAADRGRDDEAGASA